MTAKIKTVLLRAARNLAALAVGFAAAWVVSPEVLGLIPTQFDFLVTAVVAPGLVALDKYLRYGSDPGETTTPVVATPVATPKVG